MSLVQAASTSIHGPHGQHIENIHLQTYDSEPYFWDILYKERYSALLRKAAEFLDSTGGPGDDVMVFIRYVYYISCPIHPPTAKQLWL
jgi:histone deacetylase HOS3